MAIYRLIAEDLPSFVVCHTTANEFDWTFEEKVMIPESVKTLLISKNLENTPFDTLAVALNSRDVLSISLYNFSGYGGWIDTIDNLFKDHLAIKNSEVLALSVENDLPLDLCYELIEILKAFKRV